MHRLFVLLALIAAGCGVWLLAGGPDGSPPFGAKLGQPWTGVGDLKPSIGNGWALGLLMGVFLAWFFSVDWAGMPGRVGAWWRLQRRRLMLLFLGGVFAALLLYF